MEGLRDRFIFNSDVDRFDAADDKQWRPRLTTEIPDHTLDEPMVTKLAEGGAIARGNVPVVEPNGGTEPFEFMQAFPPSEVQQADAKLTNANGAEPRFTAICLRAFGWKGRGSIVAREGLEDVNSARFAPGQGFETGQSLPP